MYVGIDVGTSVVKAAAFDEDGRALAVESRPARTLRSGSRVEQDTEEVVAAAGDVLGALRPRLGGRPAAVGLTGQGDGVWLVDGRARPVRPAISWMDGRSAAIVNEWTAGGVAAEVFARTGNALFPGCPAPILAWLDRHEPRALDTAATAAYCKDVVFQRFTGVRATDASDASVPFLDPRARAYDAASLDACGLSHRAGLLAPIAEPLPRGEPLGDGPLPPGTPITAGPFDVPACALGAGVTEPGDGLLIIGTTLACLAVVDEPALDGEPTGFHFATTRPDRWLRGMPAMVGTAALEWVLARVGASHRDLDALLAESPPGARGVRVLPFFSPSGERAPFVEPAARAEITGVSLETTTADLVRATCEGIAYAARHCLDAAGLSGALSVAGGGTRSDGWLELFAGVLGRPLRVAAGEAGARGAVLAGSPELDAAAWTRPASVRDPDGTAAFYAEEYEVYKARVEAARERWRSGS
ncbi:carbohydrate kinase [Actinomadura sp. NBRC 104412]|uniref:FGGY-family carbohydrate kinase n=1 Tax=Actinomadura sp. NBRC 104412 TaxID=3032203 RepID=UPI00249FE706|nr:FGGY-family carbohydrate kinase [Actinomadura sp. NBRC 104412]GLZ07911.1 carbohydrate kinase [Actinomadura sp. NBRC 104412]